MSPQVLVVGAGTAGLTLALALKKSGIDVRIIDKVSLPMVGQRGSGIMPRTLELHGLLGTLPDILQQGNEFRVLKLYQPPSTEPHKVLGFAERRAVTPSVPYPNAVGLWQQHHEGIIRDHLKKHGTDVEYSTELTAFQQFDDHVTATLIKRSASGEETTETVTVPYLVSTEGAHSVVRKGIPLTFLGETTTQNFIVSDIEVLGGHEHQDMHMYGTPGQKAVGLMFNGPPDSIDCYMIFIGPDWDTDKLASGREALIEAFHSFTGRTDVVFGKMMTLSKYTPNIRMVNKFSEGRCFVAGDSAHVHSPTGGQGLNSGIQDSINLAWKLASVIKGQSPPSLLDTYTEERIPIIAAMLNKTRELHYRTVSRNPDDSVWQRGGALTMMGINYRASPIVLDEIHQVDTGVLPDPYDSGSEINAGDRAPDAPELVDLKGETTSLFKIFGYTHHTALVFAQDIVAAKPILEGLKAYGDKVKTVVIVPQGSSLPTGNIQADYVLEDKAGHAYHAYIDAEKPCTTVVVRPDSYIGAIVSDDGGIRKYFEKIYL